MFQWLGEHCCRCQQHWGSFHSTLDASNLGVPVLHGVTSFISAAQHFGWTVYQPCFGEVWKCLKNVRIQWCENASVNQGPRWSVGFLLGCLVFFSCRVASTFSLDYCILSPTINTVWGKK